MSSTLVHFRHDINIDTCSRSERMALKVKTIYFIIFSITHKIKIYFLQRYIWDDLRKKREQPLPPSSYIEQGNVHNNLIENHYQVTSRI